MMLKLTPEVLDRLDVFVLEVEELFVPTPLVWEWLWLLSVPVTILGLNACKQHSLKSCKQFIIGTLLCSLHSPSWRARSLLVEPQILKILTLNLV